MARAGTVTDSGTRVTGREQPPAPAQAFEAEREPNFLLARAEKRLLCAMARRVPAWIVPDDLTILGVLSALGVCAAYALSSGNTSWLWVASVLLVFHWVGDSLDGTLARVRGIERPRYGYYLDHLVDAVSTAAIGIGLGLSPHMSLAIGILLVVAYLILSINVYLESQVFGRFSIGYGRIGPTEVRLVLIVLNTLLAAGVGLGFGADLSLTVLDVLGLTIVAGMATMLGTRTLRNLRRLARYEPAVPRRIAARQDSETGSAPRTGDHVRFGIATVAPSRGQEQTPWTRS